MKSSKIGGQAVIEGVMMKNADRYAVAVRKPDGEIIVDVQSDVKDRKAINKIPVIRGVFAFIDSMVIGIKTLTFSASFFDEEEEQDTKKKSKKKADSKKPEKKAEETNESAMIAGTVAIAIVLAIAVFVLLPSALSTLFQRWTKAGNFATNLFEGILRIVIFIAYVVLISRMEDIKRVFMYHGAEHKSINCVEHGLDLTVENVRAQSREHKRCGTSFLFFVIFISVFVFMFINLDSLLLRALVRILLIPFIAGISYEFIRLAGNSDNKVINAISKPGMLLQKLTTREPDDSMIEVAIASVEAVFDWKSFVEQVRAEADKQMISEKVPTADDVEDDGLEFVDLDNDNSEIDDVEADDVEVETTGIDDIEIDDIDAANAEAERLAAEEAAKAKAEAEAKKAAEKAEKEAQKAAAKAEKEAKKAAEKAEKEAQKEAARLAAEAEAAAKAEAERKAKEEAEAAAKAEAERKAKEEAEAAAKAEAERIAKEAAEAAAKAEAERKAQEEAEAKAKEESSVRKSKDLASLDKVLFVKKEQPVREFKDPLATRKVKAELRDTDEEEEDDVLKALDKFFVFKDSND